ncbi:PREDICTED: uncharacterized protein LOC108611771 [Drosophila arizonae]|uniref:Uncharacterized protein LOC108611771 n=1 Tax=Drosophila arizonae TaxID=7263 RepID=A0ABM1NYL9_DROAR|nr:PREDICTED: uncharacterized protein LOC108611771 [Drosophila arizonae]
MTAVQQVNIQCECYHRRGLLYVVRPWAWGRPCRRCQRSMERNLVVVPTSGPAAVTLNGRRRGSAVVVTTTSPQVVAAPPQLATVTPAQTALDWQNSQQAFPSVLPAKCNDFVIVN